VQADEDYNNDDENDDDVYIFVISYMVACNVLPVSYLHSWCAGQLSLPSLRGR